MINTIQKEFICPVCGAELRVAYEVDEVRRLVSYKGESKFETRYQENYHDITCTNLECTFEDDGLTLSEGVVFFGGTDIIAAIEVPVYRISGRYVHSTKEADFDGETMQVVRRAK